MAMSAEPVREDRGSWWLWIGLALFAVLLLVVRARLEPPAAKGADVPATEFSAARGLDLLRSLVGDGSPHPAGSAASARIREAIVAELRRQGWEPTVQEGVSCSPAGSCALVRNVVARQGVPVEGKGLSQKLDGKDRAVLLMAHYDSVPAGPGAGDDLSGVVAVLEAARALKAGPPPERPVILLFTEGEELGLLGAELFVNQHPWAPEVAVVVNLEARGTSGPSLMFETIGGDSLPVARYAGAAPYPITSSLYATIYELLPNDTDLTVFKNRKDRGYHGLNFAFVSTPALYHTADDGVANLSAASLQHHGDNALAAVRALSKGSWLAMSSSNSVFFDVLGFGVVRWPQSWTIVLAVLALVLVVLAAMRRRDQAPDWGRGTLSGLLALFGAILVTALLAVGLSLALRGATPGLWVHLPQPEISSFTLLALAVTLGLAAAISRRAGAAGLWAGIWIGWAVLGVVAAVTLPGISYLFLVPALVAGILGLVLRSGGPAVTLIPAAVAALLWMPLLLPLYDGLGKQALVGIAVLAAVLFTTLAPLVPGSGRAGQRWLPAAALVLALLAAGGAFATPPYSEGTPQLVGIQHYQEAGSTEARWVVRGSRSLPPSMRQAAQFGAQTEPVYPWAPAYRAFQAPAPRLDVPAPQVTVLEDSSAGGKRRLRLLLVSNRGAAAAGLLVPPGARLESARVEGQKVPLEGSHKNAPNPQEWTELAMATLKPEGVEMEVVLGATQPLEWYLYDQSFGLPPGGEALVKARPATAVTFQDGDTTLIVGKVRI
jgi:hypothetical protein